MAGHPKRIKPTEAHARLLVEPGLRYVDVRSVAEFERGHPIGAVNVPLLDHDPDTGQLVPNEQFLEVMQAHFAPDGPLVVGCAAGGRSLRAAMVLMSEGYTDVVDMLGGYSGQRDPTGRIVEAGWEQLGLPSTTAAGDGETYAFLASKVR